MNYSGFGTGRKKKKAVLITVAVIIGVLVIGLYVLGLTLGSDSEARVEIADAIEENVRLKQELVEKDNRINELSERIKELENAAAQSEAPQQAEEEGTAEQISPRE